MAHMLSSIGLNLASELIGKLLMEIRDTSTAAHRVIFCKRSFREFSEYLNRIEPILHELWRRNIHASSDSESMKIALEDLQAQLNKASKLIDTYTCGSWMYLFLKCRSLPTEMRQITQDIERSLNALKIASLDVSLEIKETALALCETMRNAEFHTDAAADALAAEIEREMNVMHSDSEQVLSLIIQVANAMGLPIDRSSLELELDLVKKKKEELEVKKLQAEACMLAQIQAFLCRSGIVSPESESSSLSAPIHFFCPLTKRIMEDPVFLDSITYEHSAIKKWLENGNTVCPVRRCELSSTELIPNHNLRELIQEWHEHQAKLTVDSVASVLDTRDTRELEAALKNLCRVCKERNSCRQLVGDKGLIPRILELTSIQIESIQVEAMKCLCYIARLESNKDEIVSAGGIEVALDHLTEETELKKLSVCLILELAKSPNLCQVIGDTPNCIPFIVSLLSGPYAALSKEILRNLAEVDAIVIQMAEVNYYDPLVERLNEGSLSTRTFLADEISKLDHFDCRKASEINGGIIPPLLQMIAENNAETMSAPLLTFQNLSKRPENCACLLDANVASLLFRLTFWNEIRADLREQAAKTLANLTKGCFGRNKLHRNLKVLTYEESIKTMISSLDFVTPSLRVYLLQILFGLATKSSTVMHSMKKAGGIQILLRILGDSDLNVRLDLMKLLSCLAEDRENNFADQIGETHIKALVRGLLNADQEERALSVHILCCLPTKNERITQVLLEDGILDLIVQLLSPADSRNGRSSEGSLMEDALGTLLHFTNPSNLEVQKKAMELGIMPLLVGFLITGSPLSKQRAATALGHISQNTRHTSNPKKTKSSFPFYCQCFSSTPDNEDICPVHIQICAKEASFCLVNAGAVEPLVRTLQVKECQADEAAITALSTLLEESNWEAGLLEIEKAKGVGLIVHLLKSHRTSTQEKAMGVLEKIFTKSKNRKDYGPSARLPLIDLMQQGPSGLKRRATALLQLLGEMPEDSGSLPLIGDSGLLQSV